MKLPLPLFACIVVALGGCQTAPRSGSDESAYYSSYRAKPASAAVAPAAVVQAPKAVVPSPLTRVVYFEFDKAVLQPQYFEVVKQHAEYMRNDSGRRVTLEGHADQRGGVEYNLALGQRRSHAVQKALTSLGVPDGRIEAISYGEERPASNLKTEEGYRLNRRVEFSYR